MIVPEVIIELISLVHKVLALTQAVIDAETRHNSAYLAGRIKARVHQHQCQHSRRGALAMDAADGDHAFLMHQLAQHLLPGNHGYAACARRRQFRMVRVQHQCRWHYHQPVDTRQVIHAVANLHWHTNTLQCARRCRCLHIAAGHLYAIAAGPEYHLRHSRDTLTAYTHEMYACLFQMLAPLCLFVFAICATFTSSAALRPNISALASCGELPIAGASGTRILGFPNTASSLSVAAPDRHNTSVAACNAAGISAFKYGTSRY